MTREEFLQILPELIEDYQAAPDVIKHIGSIALCLIIGPSGSGKTTLIRHSGLHFVPSDTTREARPGEINGVDMNFRGDYEQVVADIRAGRFVQTARFATGDLYATKDTSYPESGVGVMPVMVDVVPNFRELGFRETVSVFNTPPSNEEWMRRLSVHPLSEEQLQRRLNEARLSFTFALTDEETHPILNDDIGLATKQLRDLLEGKVDTARELKARHIIETLLAELP